MAAVLPSQAQQAQPAFKAAAFPASPADSKKHHVATTLNYYKPAADGSPPPPSYVNKITAPTEPLVVDVTVHDVAGNELDYTLDKNGFQIYYHESKQKAFVDDDEIKREYYPETEQLLKDACVPFILVI
jgi:hypothetical protein